MDGASSDYTQDHFDSLFHNRNIIFDHSLNSNLIKRVLLIMSKSTLSRITLIIAYLLVYASTNISNYGTNSILLKLFFVLLLFLAVKFYFNSLNLSLTHELKKISGKFYLVLTIFGVILLTGSIYSLNPGFGMLKFVSMVFVGFPFIISTKLLLLNFNEKAKNIFLAIIYIFIVITSIYIFLFNPFIQNEMYKFSIGRWSHVVYARFMAPLLLLVLFHFFTKKNIKELFVISLIIGLGYYAIYISNMRAALLGLIAVLPVIMVINFLKKQLRFGHLTGLTISAALFILLYSFSPGNEIIKERYENMIITNGQIIGKDPSMMSRIIGYAISWEMIKKYPFTGTGLGGFRNYKENNIMLNEKFGEVNISEYTAWLKYPHNIFIEFQTELGIGGTLWFLYILYLIFSTTRKYFPGLTIFYLFALWFALLSKDISSNILLFSGLAFYGNPYETERIKEFFSPSKKAGVRASSSS